MFSVITIPRVSKGLNGGRINDRQHHCVFCGKSDTKIGRHLQSHHASEKDVLELKDMDHKTKGVKLDLLRLKGDFYENMKILKCGGELIVVRRPQSVEIVSYRDYVPCIHCLGFVMKPEMWRHLKTVGNLKILKKN